MRKISNDFCHGEKTQVLFGDIASKLEEQGVGGGGGGGNCPNFLMFQSMLPSVGVDSKPIHSLKNLANVFMCQSISILAILNNRRW